MLVDTVKSKSGGAISVDNSICIDVSKTLLVETIKSKSGGPINFDTSFCITNLQTNSIDSKNGGPISIDNSLCIDVSKTLLVETIKSKSGGPINFDTSFCITNLQTNSIDSKNGGPISIDNSICIDVSKTLLVETIKSKSGGEVTIDDSVNITQALFLATSGGTAAGLDYYEETTHLVTWTGPWAVDQSNNLINITRIGRIVNLEIASFTAVANTSTTASLTGGTFLPSRFRPAAQHYVVTTVSDSAVLVRGTMSVQTSGDMLLGPGISINDPFAGAGNTGLDKHVSIVYRV